MPTGMLTADWLKSQRGTGASDTELADLVAKNDHSFAGEYNLIKQKAEKYSNPQDLISSFLNYKAYGDATYKDTQMQDAQNAYSKAGPAGFSRADIQGGSMAGAVAKTGANMAAGVAKLPLTLAESAGSMIMNPRETIKSGATAISGGIADAYTGVTKGINEMTSVLPTGGTHLNTQMPTFNPDGTMTDTGLTPEQEQFHKGFLENQLGLSSALQGNFGTALDKATTGLVTDPTMTAMALSPLSSARGIGKGNLGPISTVSDMVGQGISKAGDYLQTSAENSIKAAKENFARSLVSPKESPAVKLDQTMRTTEVGTGPFKRSVVAPMKREVQMAQAVSDLPLDPNGTFQKNLNIIKESNIAEADGLKTSLEMNNFHYSPDELRANLNKVKTELKNNPVLVGDSAKIATKLIEELDRRVQASPKDGASLLQLRKDFDSWVETQKGSGVFDPVKENAFSAALRPIRRSINDFLEAKAPNAGVKASLAKQSALFDAMDNIAPKAALEANSAWERVAQKVHTVAGKLRLGPTGVGVTGVGAAFGLYAAPQLAAILGGLGAGTFFLYKAGKMMMSPKLRMGASSILHILEKVAIDNPAMYQDIAPIIQEINLLKNGETPSVPRTTGSNIGSPSQKVKVQESTSPPTLPEQTKGVNSKVLTPETQTVPNGGAMQVGSEMKVGDPVGYDGQGVEGGKKGMITKIEMFPSGFYEGAPLEQKASIQWTDGTETDFPISVSDLQKYTKGKGGTIIKENSFPSLLKPLEPLAKEANIMEFPNKKFFIDKGNKQGFVLNPDGTTMSFSSKNKAQAFLNAHSPQ